LGHTFWHPFHGELEVEIKFCTQFTCNLHNLICTAAYPVPYARSLERLTVRLPLGSTYLPGFMGILRSKNKHKQATFNLGWHTGPQSLAHRAVKGNWLLTTKTSDKFLHRAHNQTHPKPNHFSQKTRTGKELNHTHTHTPENKKIKHGQQFIDVFVISVCFLQYFNGFS
jgi:hypothetical protein